MKELVVASRNKGKITEIKQLLSDLNVEILSLNEFLNIPKIEEDGKTFEENAIKKAKAVAQALGKIALADDSGIEIEFLNGAPGIHSAKYKGEDISDRERNQHVLKELEGVPWERRKARFKCVIALARPTGQVETATGICEGIIGFEQKGDCGFGYDPIFVLPKYGKTFAQLGLEVKNKESHRAKALEKAREILKEWLEES